MGMNIAYLANGKMWMKLGDAPARAFESKFGEKVRTQEIIRSQKNAWKSEERQDTFLSGMRLWGRTGARDPDKDYIAVTSIAKGSRAGEFYYTLETGHISGVFVVENDGQDERRLAHHTGFSLTYLHRQPDQDLMLCGVRDRYGASHIAVMDHDGSNLREVTEGDAVDIAPRWIPGRDRQFVFQSAGIGRDKNGRARGQGAFAVQKLDLRTGEMVQLLENKNFDFLGPAVAGDGTLYAIRRPYANASVTNPFRLLWIMILIPFRLLHAFFQWLNWFNVRYTGKTLTSGGGGVQKEEDMKQMMIWGNLIKADNDQRRRTGDETPDLVPKSWQLVRMGPNENSPSVIARGVLSFDVADDGTIIYTNGSGIFRISASGSTEKILSDALIQQVVLLPQ